MNFSYYKDLNVLPIKSDRHFESTSKHSMFVTREWFENLISYPLESDQQLFFACVEDENNMLAILPLLKNENNGLSSLSHAYSSFYSILLNEDKEQEKEKEQRQTEILTTLGQGLINQTWFKSLTLKPIDEGDDTLNQFIRILESSGLTIKRNFLFYNWFHQTNKQSFTEYKAQLPSQVRNTIDRKQRKLKREHNYKIHLFIDDGVEQALNDYHELYKDSWKVTEQNRELVEGMVDRFAKRGWLRLAVLYVNEQAIAAHLWFVVGKKANIFRLVYDLNWKQYSPGTILMSYLLEYVIDTDGVNEIDFLTGNEKYKQDWMSERREKWGVTLIKKKQPEKSQNLLTKVKTILKNM